MLFDNIDLPEDVKMYMREICSNDELEEAFRYFDVEVLEDKTVCSGGHRRCVGNDR